MTQLISPASTFLVQKAQFNNTAPKNDAFSSNLHTMQTVLANAPARLESSSASSNAPNTFEISAENASPLSQAPKKFNYSADECEFILSMFRQINVEANGMTTKQYENGTRRTERRENMEADDGRDSIRSNDATHSADEDKMEDEDSDPAESVPQPEVEGQDSESEDSSPFHLQVFHFQGEAFHLLKLTPSSAIWSTRNRDQVLICHNMRFFVCCLYFQKVRFVRVEELMEHARRQVLSMERDIGER